VTPYHNVQDEVGAMEYDQEAFHPYFLESLKELYGGHQDESKRQSSGL